MEREVGPLRDELLAGLTDRVVEVGAGNGTSFGHYPTTVDELVAVEPEPYLRQRAIERAGSAPIRTHVVDGVAEALPLEDGSADAVVASGSEPLDRDPGDRGDPSGRLHPHQLAGVSPMGAPPRGDLVLVDDLVFDDDGEIRNACSQAADVLLDAGGPVHDRLGS